MTSVGILSCAAWGRCAFPDAIRASRAAGACAAKAASTIAAASTVFMTQRYSDVWCEHNLRRRAQRLCCRLCTLPRREEVIMIRWLARLCCLLLLWVVSTAALRGQGSAGQIEGTVRDEQGGGRPGGTTR